MPENTEALNPTPPSPSGALSPTLRDLTGKVFGDFRILRPLGQGGMGQVYLAEQISLKRHVALKFLKPELAANKTSLERFQREAEAVARASHANIVQIYSIGDVEGMHFMALEYVEGRSLREFIEKKGPPEIQLGLRIMSQVALALQQAGELGIVHRDIKPENILINRKGDVKVTDFGLSRHFKQDSNLTESRIAMGTPLYMSPEQVEGKPVDHRSDIYSFGATSYHLFAGHAPFKGQTPFEVALQHVNKEPQPLAEIRPDLPADLCMLIHRMLAKRPEQRYQTGREVVRDLSRLRDALVASGGSLPSSVLAGLTPSGGVINLGLEESGPYVSRTPRRKLSWKLATFATVALIAGLALGWAMTPPRTIAVPAAPAEGKSQELPPAVQELFSARERTKDLARRVEEHLKSPNPLIANPGMMDSVMDLGVVYLRERRWDEADAYFKKLDSPEKRFLSPYPMVAQLGHGMVLAFRDQPAESNGQFILVLDRIDGLDRGEGPGKLDKKKNPPFLKAMTAWRSHVGWLEMMAEAIERNHANDPANFPKDPRLEALRRPPGLGAKAVAPPP